MKSATYLSIYLDYYFSDFIQTSLKHYHYHKGN